jgi:hypothetical protein
MSIEYPTRQRFCNNEVLITVKLLPQSFYSEVIVLGILHAELPEPRDLLPKDITVVSVHSDDELKTALNFNCTLTNKRLFTITEFFNDCKIIIDVAEQNKYLHFKSEYLERYDQAIYVVVKVKYE